MTEQLWNQEQGRVLLSVRNLKQYFEVKSAKGFHKKTEYVKANDGISVDIYEGETLGLVGESGCGKSTFGRVLLQLYHPTEGEIIYYGTSVKDFLPEYRKQIYDTLPQKVHRLKELRKKLQEEKNPIKTQLKLEQLETQLAREVGGLLCSDQIELASRYLRKQYRIWKQQREIKDNVKQQRKNTWNSKLKELEEQECEIEKQLNYLREQCREDKDFKRYEELKVNGINLSRLTQKEMRRLRKDLQMVFQDPYSSLNPRMTVGQLIGEGVQMHGLVQNRKSLESYVAGVMEKCGLSPYMLFRYPHQFSGGQRQRIGIARSLALQPKFLICDEAVSALDVSIQSQIINLLLDLKEKEQLTYLFISHDLSVVRYLSDRVGVMYLGKLVELAQANELFSNPLHPYTRALLSAIPNPDGKKRETIELKGEVPSPRKPPSGCRFHTRCRDCMQICIDEEPLWEEGQEKHYVACHKIHLRG